MHKSKADNGIFIDTLVMDPDIGGVLSQYMRKEKIRTYIKDGVLRVYTRDKRDSVLPADADSVLDIIESIYEKDGDVIHFEKDICLLRLNSKKFILATAGTFIKWETALRKALEFIAKSPGLPPNDLEFEVLLIIAILNSPITESDKKHLYEALNYINVKIVFI